MKRFALVLALSLLSAQVLAGVDTKVYALVKNKSVNDSGLVLAVDPVVQGGITFTLQQGGYLDLWFSHATGSGPANDYGDEVDFTLGWRGRIAGEIDANLGVAELDLYPTQNLNSHNVTKIFAEIAPLRLAVPLGPTTLTPYARVEVIRSTGRGYTGKGLYYLGARDVWAVGQGLSLVQRLHLLDTPDLPGVSGGLVASYKLEAPYALGHGVVFTPSFEWIHPYIDQRPKNSHLFAARIEWHF